MILRAAVWGQGPAVFFTEEHLPELAARRIELRRGKALALSVDFERGVMHGLPSNYGPRLRGTAQREGFGPWRYIVQTGEDDADVPFEMALCDCRAEWDGIRLSIVLPVFPQMPWPQLETRGEERRRDFARAQVQARRLFAERQGYDEPEVPQRYLELL